MNLVALNFKFISLLGGFATIGSLLAMTFLLLDDRGKLSASSERIRNYLKISAAVWVVGSLGNIVATLAQLLNTTFFVAIDQTVLRSFTTQITLGRYLAFQSLVSLLVLIIAFKARKILSLISTLVLSLLAIVAPVFQSHSASGGSHSLVIGSLVIHVVALSFWVGGVLAIAQLSQTERVVAVPRFSSLALWAAIAVVISGSINAWARLNFSSAWNSTYAYIVIAKVIATIALVGLGYLHRKNLEKKDSIDWKTFSKLLTTEAISMIVTVQMGSWLS